MFKITEELLFKISILIAFAIYFYLSLQFPSIPMQEGYGAGLFPIIISISFFLFAIKDFLQKISKNLIKRKFSFTRVFNNNFHTNVFYQYFRYVFYAWFIFILFEFCIKNTNI